MEISDVSEWGSNPFPVLEEWLEDAKRREIAYPTAMSLATLGENGLPNVRTVLARRVSSDGVAFFTNYESQKGQEIAATPSVAALFYWEPLERQIRIRGSLARTTPEESDAYFASRPRESQISTWASQQSRVMSDPAEFEKSLTAYTKNFAGKNVPRPQNWGGFIITPLEIEFWKEGLFRRHTRRLYQKKTDGNWEISCLYP